MEYITKYLKKNSWWSILISIIIGIFGITLMIKPNGILRVMSYIIGIIFMLIGIYRITDYIRTKNKEDFYNMDFTNGIIAMILGIIVIAFSNEIESIFRIIIGIWILYSAITKLGISLKLKNIKVDMWIYGFILSIIMIACGLYVICTPTAIIVTVGVMLLTNSILDIIEDLIFIKNINKLND